LDATPCKFPECVAPAALEVAPRAWEAFFVCVEHRQLLLDDPGEFHCRWGAINPRRDAATPYALRQRSIAESK
jgi:hypothetical protein